MFQEHCTMTRHLHRERIWKGTKKLMSDWTSCHFLASLIFISVLNHRVSAERHECTHLFARNLTPTVKTPVFGTLSSAISNLQTWFVRTVMEVLKYCWMYETSNMQCNYNSFIQIINFHGLFHNALRWQKTGACRILVPLRYFNLLQFITVCFIC